MAMMNYKHYQKDIFMQQVHWILSTRLQIVELIKDFTLMNTTKF